LALEVTNFVRREINTPIPLSDYKKKILLKLRERLMENKKWDFIF
jgi:hypothetical protein